MNKLIYQLIHSQFIDSWCTNWLSTIHLPVSSTSWWTIIVSSNYQLIVESQLINWLPHQLFQPSNQQPPLVPAAALPMPRLAPVTQAVRPLKAARAAAGQHRPAAPGGGLVDEKFFHFCVGKKWKIHLQNNGQMMMNMEDPPGKLWTVAVGGLERRLSCKEHQWLISGLEHGCCWKLVVRRFTHRDTPVDDTHW